jgi:superkiller protein 3
MKKRNVAQYIIIAIGIIGNIQLLRAQDNAIDWFNRGTEAISPQEKITCYLQAIELNPKFIEAFYNLGYVYKNSGDFNNAEKAFRNALSINPDKLNDEDKLRINYELAITLKRLNRNPEAMKTLEVAKNLARQTEIRAAVLYELGRTKLLAGDLDGALAEFNEGLQLNSSKQDAFESAIENARTLRELEANYVKGMRYLNNGQYDEAIDALTSVVNTNPNYKDSNQKLTEAQQMKDRKTKVDNLSDIYARGIGYMQRNDWANAIIAFKQVEQVEPDYKDVKAKLAESQLNLDQSLQQEVFEKIYNDGMADYRKGNWITAIVAFEKVKEWNPNFKNVDRMYRDAQNRLSREGEDSVKNQYYGQGKTYLNNREWESAIATFRQLKNLDPNFKDVQFLIQQAQNGLENQAKSVQLDNYYTEGLNYYGNGEWLKAILTFEKIQQINPEYKDVSEKLAEAQSKLNQAQVAETLAEQPGKKQKSQKETKNWMLIGILFSAVLIPTGLAFFAVPSARAKFLLMQGNYQKAALIYESILMKKPTKVKLYPLLANIYLMMNRNDETAQKVYDLALKMDISSNLRQRLDEMNGQKLLDQNSSGQAESLEEQLKRELLSLKNS